MKRLFLAGVALAVALTGCSFRLESPVLPNIDLKGQLPTSTDLARLAPNTNINQQSRSEGVSGSKQVLANLTVAANVNNELVMSTAANCIQLVKLASGAVVVDFAGQACPASSKEAVDENSLLYTATYQKIETDRYKLMYEGKELGEFQLSSDGLTVTITALCTGSYTYRCYQATTNDRLAAAPYFF